MTILSVGLTGPNDRSFLREIEVLFYAIRRRLPQPLRRQARLEYRVLYVFNMTIGIPETAFQYSRIGFSALMCWACQLVNYQTGASWWRYWTSCNAVAVARTSLNISAYQAGCLSARWGLVLNCISRLGSRALLSFYQVCFNHTNFFNSNSSGFPLNLNPIGMALWTRALCIYRYAKLLFALTLDRYHRWTGELVLCKYWHETWRIACIDLMQHKLDITFHEISMVAPALANFGLNKVVPTVRLLVEHRLLRGPFPTHQHGSY